MELMLMRKKGEWLHTEEAATHSHQRSEDARAQYLLEVGIYKPNTLVLWMTLAN